VPIKARSTGQWIVTATLPIRSANGQFDGLIVGSVPLAFFDHVWKFDDDDIRGLAIALWRDDGVLLMRSPIDERVMGLATMGPVLFSRIREGHVKGRFDTVSTIDGLQRLRFSSPRCLPQFHSDVFDPGRGTCGVVASRLIVAAG
jgi:hypothetical protein